MIKRLWLAPPKNMSELGMALLILVVQTGVNEAILISLSTRNYRKG
jgi:hypothetical protein